MEPDPRYAGFARRAGAALLDGLVISIPGTFAHQAGITTGSFWPDLLLESLVWLPYYVLLPASRWQATPGKLAFGIKITGLDGRRIGIGRSLARYLASFLSALALFIGYLMVPFTRKRQAMHDMMAGTLVVSAESGPGAVPADHHVMPLTGGVVSAVATVVALFILFVWVTAFILPSPHEAERIAAGVPVGPSTGPSHQLGYALYGFPYFGGEKKLLKEGTRTYRLGDVLASSTPGWDDARAEKRVPVVDGFNIVAQVQREPVVQGFGLQLEKQFGFSWEWFDRETGYTFKKRQGPGRVQVRIATGEDGKEEVAEILFLDDITLRLDRNMLVPFTGPATEHLVVRKGSVLSLKD